MDNSTAQATKLTPEGAIDIIRQVRNDLIKDFLSDDKLLHYFISEYKKHLSKINLEFLKRELKELLIAPVDLSHYASLIKTICELDSASPANGNRSIFYKDLEKIFIKYKY
jgi:hypothetical protein